MNKKYVPPTRSGFRAWVNSVYDLVNTNAVLWGIPPALVTQFAALLAQFELLYVATDNKTLRSGSQVIAFRVCKAEFSTFMRNLVQVHLLRNTAIPYETKIAMNLNVRIDNNNERPDIDSTPIIGLANGNRAVIKIKLYVPDMGKRAKIHPDADAAELRFFITAPPVIILPAAPVQGSGGTPPAGNSGSVPPAPTPAPIPVPVPPPASGTVMETFVTTRGSFERKMEAYIGKAFVVQGRWINTTDESKNGTWSDFFIIVIA